MEKSTVTTYKRLLFYVKPYWKKILFGLLCTIVVAGVDGSIAWIVKPVLDDIFIKQNKTMLPFLSLLVVVLYLVKGIFRFLSGYLMNYTGHIIVMNLRNHLFQHTQTLSINFFSDNQVGGLLSKLINDVGAVQGMVSTAIKDFIREFFTMIVLVAVLFHRDWKMAIISFTVLPASAYCMGKVGSRLKYLGRCGQEKIADMSSLLVEFFSGVRVVKAFRNESLTVEKFQKESEHFFEIMKRTIKYKEFTTPFMEFIGAVGIGFIIFYGGKGVIDGTMTTGNFFSFMTALLMMYSPIRRISNINNIIQQASASAVRIFELFDTETEIKEKKDAITSLSLSDTIEFRDVSFSYDSNSDTILHDINIQAKKGEIIAIVGMSGGGKTTLLNLLPRFYDVSSGSILIDGIDIRDVTLSALRTMIGIVTQDIFLFNDTIKNNIAFGNLVSSDDDVIAAAQSAYCHQFIMELPQQYDTITGERGIKLSGGEKQRIAIARALLKNPSIMILDEATSALDTESEQVVQKALNNVMKDRTTFVIAHRYSTILNANHILVLENGRIVEAGTHEKLLAKGGAYKKVYELQFTHTGGH